MAKVLLSAYAAVALYFLSAYLPRPTVIGVIASLLWPVTVAVALTWLMMIDEDALML
jgi:hypothetical protein